MTLDRLIERILSAKPELTRETVLGLIREKIVDAGELLTDEGAAYVVAAELGVSISEGNQLETDIRLDDLVPGTRDVSVVGRVITICPVQKFTRKDGAEGRVGRMILADRTCRVSVVLWDDKVDILSQGRLTRGQIIRVAHGYVREGLDGSPEVNVGNKGRITVSQGENAADFPHVEDFFKKIGELKSEENGVNVTGILDSITPTSTFQREEGVGRVARARLTDETGEIWAVFWNEMTDSLTNAKHGDRIEIMNARTRGSIQNNMELHVSRRSQVTISNEKRDVIAPPSH